MTTRMRALLLTSGQPNQVALAARLSPEVDIVGVVVSGNIRSRAGLRREVRRISNACAVRTVGRPFRTAWHELQDHYADRFGSSFPAGAETIHVDSANDPATIAAIAELGPDVLLVSGTNLVRRPVIAAMRGRTGTLNLHTGISPYLKGAPNCTNWCLAKSWFSLIGNTVMWLDDGIDSGPLIATERTQLTGHESLLELHLKVMDHAHSLYARVVRALGAGVALPGVPQTSLGPGHTFYGDQWSWIPMLRARNNFRMRYGSALPIGAGDQTGGRGPVLVEFP